MVARAPLGPGLEAEPKHLDQQAAIDALIAHGGRIDEACEVLGSGPGRPLSRATFIRALTGAPAEAISAIRMAALLNAFDLSSKLSAVAATEMGNMDAEVMFRNVIALTQQIDQFTRKEVGAPMVGSGNIVQLIMGQLPREGANAMRALTSMDMDTLHGFRRELMERSGQKAIDITPEGD